MLAAATPGHQARRPITTTASSIADPQSLATLLAREWLDMAGFMAGINLKTLSIEPEMLALIGELDEFKGAWRALGTLAPERLSALRRVATIESVGSSTRIEGSKLSDRAVEKLLFNLEIQSFKTRDEQEVAGYASIMETVFASWQALTLTENHIKQLHRDLLRHSTKDRRHRGEYKKFDNHVTAFDAGGKTVGIVFQTASPFDTPRLMKELVDWTSDTLASLADDRGRLARHGKGRGTWYALS